MATLDPDLALATFPSLQASTRVSNEAVKDSRELQSFTLTSRTHDAGKSRSLTRSSSNTDSQDRQVPLAKEALAALGSSRGSMSASGGLAGWIIAQASIMDREPIQSLSFHTNSTTSSRAMNSTSANTTNSSNSAGSRSELPASLLRRLADRSPPVTRPDPHEHDPMTDSSVPLPAVNSFTLGLHFQPRMQLHEGTPTTHLPHPSLPEE